MSSSLINIFLRDSTTSREPVACSLDRCSTTKSPLTVCPGCPGGSHEWGANWRGLRGEATCLRSAPQSRAIRGRTDTARRRVHFRPVDHRGSGATGDTVYFPVRTCNVRTGLGIVLGSTTGDDHLGLTLLWLHPR